MNEFNELIKSDFKENGGKFFKKSYRGFIREYRAEIEDSLQFTTVKNLCEFISKSIDVEINISTFQSALSRVRESDYSKPKRINKEQNIIVKNNDSEKEIEPQKQKEGKPKKGRAIKSKGSLKKITDNLGLNEADEDVLAVYMNTDISDKDIHELLKRKLKAHTIELYAVTNSTIKEMEDEIYQFKDYESYPEHAISQSTNAFLMKKTKNVGG